MHNISAAQRLLPAFFSIQGLPAYELVVDAKAPGTFTYSDAVGSVAIDLSNRCECCSAKLYRKPLRPYPAQDRQSGYVRQQVYSAFLYGRYFTSLSYFTESGHMAIRYKTSPMYLFIESLTRDTCSITDVSLVYCPNSTNIAQSVLSQDLGFDWLCLMWGGPPNYSGYPNSVSVRQAMEFL